MVAIGVGGADAVDVMAGMAWEQIPKTYRCQNPTSKLSGWTALRRHSKIAEILTVKVEQERLLNILAMVL
jgi:aconitate hydratase